MKIKILKLLANNMIEFAASCGTAIAFCEKLTGIEEGKDYYAEIDIDSPVDLHANAKIVPKGQYLIRHTGNKNEIQGIVEDIDDDGMIYLRLGVDCLVMIENQSSALNKGNGLLLSIDVHKTRITI